MSDIYDSGFTIKVTNHLTGEMSDIDIKNPDQAVNVLQELTASEKAIKSAITNLKTYIDVEMGQDDKVLLGNYQVERVQRTTRTWTREGLLSVGLDEDAIAVVSSINMTAAKAVIEESIERGDIQPDAKKVLYEAAEYKTTAPYLTFKQVR